MTKKLTAWKTKGMNRDLSVSALNPEFAFENRNLRLSTNEGNTLLSWVNEKSTASIPVSYIYYDSEGKPQSKSGIEGTPIGTAVLNHKLVIFTHTGTKDRIYSLEWNADKTAMTGTRLFENNLGFSTERPLETLVSYESELVQKVYWTDGEQQPRVINIAIDDERTVSYTTTSFDFIPELALNEKVSVKKILSGGMFAPGVIQYAFTYYNKYGQESNIFYTTPLLYISHLDRGGSPEDKIANSFEITISDVDSKFEFIRIYSIQRTSLNATPIAKRVTDVSLENLTGSKVSYTDTGTSGDSIDPTELLYKGGETIAASTIEQKDGTLFLGNLKIRRTSLLDIKEDIKTAVSPTRSNRYLYFNNPPVGTEDYPYANQLTSFSDSNCTKSVPCNGFKTGNYYRLGVQFQYKTGKWSEPIFIQDFEMVGNSHFAISYKNEDHPTRLRVPTIQGTLTKAMTNTIIGKEYKKIRPVVVFPEVKDRIVLCQGVVNPTVYTDEERDVFKSVYAQSSWFFRPSQTDDKFILEDTINDAVSVSPTSSKVGNTTELEYTSRFVGKNIDSDKIYYGTAYNPAKIRQVEIEGDYEEKHRFKLDYKTLTFNSPDIEFDTNISVTTMKDVKYQQVGYVQFAKTLADIDIQTVTPTIHKSGTGFLRKSSTKTRSFGIVSGLFYDDFIVDENVNDRFAAYPHEKSSAKWLIYPWQRNGALNNDINRPEDQGVMSAELKKKVISNLRVAETLYDSSIINSAVPEIEPQVFFSEENTILKVGNLGLYRGNVDTMLSPDNADGKYFAFEGFGSQFLPGTYTFAGFLQKETSFTSKIWWKTLSLDPSNTNQNGIRVYIKKDGTYRWEWIGEMDWPGANWNGDDIGDDFVDLVVSKMGVRMKYKSSPHIIFKEDDGTYVISWSNSSSNRSQLPIVEIFNNFSLERLEYLFGGTSEDALRENNWIPCGEPVELGKSFNGDETSGKTIFEWSYGDTYYQRYDCLKTYAFTREDANQVVEIGSFMLETYENIDGRYDRNRGQSNNLNMSPTNFNLYNPVYSQVDNFFTYKIMDEDSYKNQDYPNQITWSKTKENGADVDLWTNVTLASVLEMDGDKGKVTSIQRLNNQLVCFQDTGISRILYNDNVQIQSTQGVPIEIANSGKVQGKDYISNTIGCSNKWSIASSPNGIYFMDSNDKSIYILGGQGLQNVSQSGGFNSWAKSTIPASNVNWTPDGFDNFITYFDKMNQDLLFVNKNEALAFSEKVQAFTSFYDYGNTPFFCNLDDGGIWIKSDGSLWKHQGGEDYCKFFNVVKPYSMTLVGNPEPQLDKIFTNLEFRACVEGDGEFNQSTGKFIPTLPFNSLETWDEYQHGITTLENKNGHSAMVHGGNSSSLKRKFRIWRCDIPRDNYPVSPASEALQGISRFKARPNDRMRNPWLYLKLLKEGNTQHKIEIHDLVMTYFE